MDTDRLIPVPGRMPVLEALNNLSLHIDKVLVSTSATGESLASILGAAARRRIPVERVPEQRVSQIAGSSRHHQGVVADVVAPNMESVERFCDRRRKGRDWACRVLVLDRVHNPANVGMVLRTAVAAGIDGVVLPRRGTADIGPVAIKASAGLAFSAPVLRCDTTENGLDVLAQARFELVGVDVEGESLFDADLPDRVALVLGNETDGLSAGARDRVTRTVALPLANGVESLNVAVAAGVVAYELVRRITAR